MTLLWGVFLRHLTTLGGDINVRFRGRWRA